MAITAEAQSGIGRARYARSPKYAIRRVAKFVFLYAALLSLCAVILLPLGWMHGPPSTPPLRGPLPPGSEFEGRLRRSGG